MMAALQKLILLIQLRKKSVNMKTLDDIKNDGRYTYNSEYCGYLGTKRVARFNHEFIGAFDTLSEALQACLVFDNERMKDYL